MYFLCGTKMGEGRNWQSLEKKSVLVKQNVSSIKPFVFRKKKNQNQKQNNP